MSFSRVATRRRCCGWFAPWPRDPSPGAPAPRPSPLLAPYVPRRGRRRGHDRGRHRAGVGPRSALETILSCLREARRRLDPDWTLILSGQDYPLRPMADIESDLDRSESDALIGLCARSSHARRQTTTSSTCAVATATTSARAGSRPATEPTSTDLRARHAAAGRGSPHGPCAASLLLRRPTGSRWGAARSRPCSMPPAIADSCATPLGGRAQRVVLRQRASGPPLPGGRARSPALCPVLGTRSAAPGHAHQQRVSCASSPRAPISPASSTPSSTQRCSTG
jgi:hypothetical protein